MATLTLTPTLLMVRKNADGTYWFYYLMRDAGGVEHSNQVLRVGTDGTITDAGGNATRTSLTAGQMTTLNSNWATYQAGVIAVDADGKLPL